MRSQTRAAVLVELNQPLRIVELGIPEPGPGQVLVEIAYSGVCHSQLLEVQGKRGTDRFLPHLLGHEGSGVVLRTGAGVTKVKAGDRVVLSWIRGSGIDIPATVYQSAEGPVNSGAICTFMGQTLTCESRVTPIPAAMPLREAALLGCAVPTGAGAVLNTGAVRPGGTVAVFGIGGIGLGAVTAAKLINAGTIIAVDIYQHKLDQARAAGATDLIDARQQDPLQAIRALTDGHGVDCAIEAAGRRETAELAFQAVRHAGGLCVLAGNLPHGECISIDPMDLIRGKRIVGTWGGETQPDRDIATYARLFLAGNLRLDRLITHMYSLHEVNVALEDLRQGRVGRALIDMAMDRGQTGP